MAKFDYKKDLKELYFPPAKNPVLVEVPEMNFVMADGSGDPNTSKDFQEAVEVLYGLSYTAKFSLKKQGTGAEYVVPALEGMWWSPGGDALNVEAKDKWLWTLMIMQPPAVTAELIASASDELRRKKNPAALDRVRFETFTEGLCAQIMHIGPYSEERPTIEKLHAFIRESGHTLRGKHHEIYLGDPRRTAPEMLKTVVRQPVT